MFSFAEAIGHARDVIANDPLEALFVDAGGKAGGKALRGTPIAFEQFGDDPLPPGIGVGYIGMLIHAPAQEIFQAPQEWFRLG